MATFFLQLLKFGANNKGGTSKKIQQQFNFARFLDFFFIE